VHTNAFLTGAYSTPQDPLARLRGGEERERKGEKAEEGQERGGNDNVPVLELHQNMPWVENPYSRTTVIWTSASLMGVPWAACRGAKESRC